MIPKLAEFMEWIETGIEKFGTDKARKYGKWGMQTKMTDLEHQQYMTEFFKDNKDMDIVDGVEALMCGAECGPGTMRELDLLNLKEIRRCVICGDKNKSVN